LRTARVLDIREQRCCCICFLVTAGTWHTPALAVPLIKRLIRDSKGQDLIEYAVLSALIALVVVAAISAVGLKVSQVFVRMAAAL